MFLKNNKPGTAITKPPSPRKEAIPSIITHGMHLLGNVVSDGNVDFDGTLDGNIRCTTLTIRPNGCIKGDAVADSVFVYGKVRGLIRAKYVHLFATCNVEGVIMHEAITIEDGAFIDGKFKRTDKPQNDDNNDNNEGSGGFFLDDDSNGNVKMLENIRLIR